MTLTAGTPGNDVNATETQTQDGDWFLFDRAGTATRISALSLANDTWGRISGNVTAITDGLGTPAGRAILNAADSEAQRQLLALDAATAPQTLGLGTAATLGASDNADWTQDGDHLADRDAIDARITAQIADLSSRAPDYVGSTSAGVARSVSHGLGALPSRVEVHAVCVTATFGYAVGDRIVLASQEGDSGRATTLFFNAQVAGFNSNSSSYLLAPRSGAGRFGLLTTNWQFEFRVWR